MMTAVTLAITGLILLCHQFIKKIYSFTVFLSKAVFILMKR